MIRILIVVRQMTLGGAERRLSDLAEALSGRDDFQVRIANLTGIDVDKQLKDAKPVRNQFQRILFLKKEISDFKPDIVHCFDIPSGIYSRIVQITTGAKFTLISGFGSGITGSNFFIRLLKFRLFYPDFFICNSEKGLSELKKLTKNRVPSMVVYNGLRTERFADPAPKPEWAETDIPVVGYIGKLNQIKKGQRVLEIARLYRNEPNPPRFIVFAGGPELEKTRNEIENDEFLKRTVFLQGMVPDAARYSHYFRVGLLCSDSEGFPNSLLEFMALGVPSVSTNVGDVAVMINNENEQTGILIESFDAQAFKNAIDKLLNDPIFYNKLRDNGIKRFRKIYTIDIMLDNYINIYNNIKKLVSG